MSEPIRVAQVLGCMTGYGMERYVMNFYRHIDRSKIQFDFFAHDDSTDIPREEIEKLGGRVYIIPTYWRLWPYLRTLKRLFRQNGYPIVHSQIGVIGVLPLSAARCAGVPIRIAHNHTSTAKGEKRNALMYTLRPFVKVFATHYVAVSALVGGWLFGKRAMERGKVTIFHTPVDVAAYRYDEAVRMRVRGEMNLDGRFAMGHVGRFCYQKNQEFLIDIFRAVRAKRPDALLMLVGDGETKEAVEAKARVMGLQDDILMLDKRDDVNRLYQAMDVLVLPSRYEGLPTVALEAQLAELRVITSTSVTTEAKVSDDMVYLDLSAGAECWAEEILKTSTGERACVGDFSPFDITVQAKQMERYYLELLQGVKEKI